MILADSSFENLRNNGKLRKVVLKAHVLSLNLLSEKS